MKNHHPTLYRYILIAVFFMVATSCKETPNTTAPKEEVETATSEKTETMETTEAACLGRFAHNVYFWFKEPNNEAHRQQMMASCRTLARESQYIQTVHIGTPALSDRDVVDDSFTFSWVVTFANAADQAAYQTEPVHLKFIEEASHLWEKVLVYDSEEINIP
tara:strand:- start:12957 stop:13442 length:486 start_codon:yes stop_codon:yes gene_type:complete